MIKLVIPAGFEPATYCLEGSCSIQLSYGTTKHSFNLNHTIQSIPDVLKGVQYD